MRRTTTRNTLATNLAHLMDKKDWSQKKLAEVSGVAQKTISNMLNAGKPGIGASTLDKVEAVAKAFGLEGWHLLMPNLPDDIVDCKSLSQLVSDFLEAPPEGQTTISHTAHRERQLGAK